MALLVSFSEAVAIWSLSHVPSCRLGLNIIICNNGLAVQSSWRYAQDQLALMQRMIVQTDTVTLNTLLNCQWDDWQSGFMTFLSMQNEDVLPDQYPSGNESQR